MAANVETMFSVREKPWHGLGKIVMEAPTSKDALRLAGLDWNVVQEPIYTEFNEVVEGYKANVRDSDRKVLGVVSDRYKVVQNTDAFSFTDELLGKGVRYETAGSLQEGKKRWMGWMSTKHIRRLSGTISIWNLWCNAILMSKRMCRRYMT